MRSVFSLLSVLLLTIAAVGQKAVPPPPKPADHNPSLPTTMKFIQDKLNDEGTFNYVIFVHDDVGGSEWTLRKVVAETNVVADPATCRINYHWKDVKNGSTVYDTDLWFNLKGVQSLSVMTLEQNQKLVDTDSGEPGRSYRIEPAIFVLRVIQTRNSHYDFFFHDEETANRVAKAMTHAVELCGGGDNAPF